MISNDSRIYIYGAHSRGRTLGYYLKYLYPDLQIEAYLYDNDEENPREIGGVPVLRIDGTSNLHQDYPVYLANRGVNHAHQSQILGLCGMQTIIPVDFKLDLKIRNAYLRKHFAESGRKFLKLEDMEISDHFDPAEGQGGGLSARIYVAHSAVDRPLQDLYELKSYESIIQVGASLTDIRWSGTGTDDSGDNISWRNVQFCELTGLYWIWKNAREDVVGLVHYRRHFLFPEDWVERMTYHGIDVILPLPLYVGPNIEENYKSRHLGEDWDFMVEYLRQRDPDEAERIMSFFRTTALYSPCNMLAVRRAVLDDLCEWLFPILFAVAEHGGQKEDAYMNRYPGFLAERLITYFFERHSEQYRVVYADKNFLQ